MHRQWCTVDVVHATFPRNVYSICGWPQYAVVVVDGGSVVVCSQLNDEKFPRSAALKNDQNQD